MAKHKVKDPISKNPTNIGTKKRKVKSKRKNKDSKPKVKLNNF